MLVRPLVLAQCLLFTSAVYSTVCAQSPAAASSLPLAGSDEALNVHIDLLWSTKTKEEVFAFVEKAYAADARPHVKARYGEFLIWGKNEGGPEGQAEKGLALAMEALEAGSVHARKVVGWELLRGALIEKDVQRGVSYLQDAISAGNAQSMVTMGDVYFYGVGIPSDVTLAGIWYRRAAYQGKPRGLYRLGQAYEEGRIGGAPNLARAYELYAEAASRGTGDAVKRIREQAEAGNPIATRARNLETLWRASLGADYTTTRVKRAARALEDGYPDDPQVLVALGRVYSYEYSCFHDYKKALGFFRKAMELGSTDGRCEYAVLLAEGKGVKKDPPAALAILRELEAKGLPLALAYLSYYHYWGNLKHSGLPKDAEKAFTYALRAANAGNLQGQVQVGICCEFGIGTPVDYGKALHYYRAAAWRGEIRSEKKMHKLLDHVK